MISKPTNNNIDKLAGLTLPVNYNTEQGLALLLSNIIVSSCGVTPYFRMIPTAQYVSGNYTFPLPAGYLKVPYRLPMLEPKTWSALGDTIDALNPVALYQIGTDADPMTRDFPVIINTSDYTVDGVVVKPLELNQSVVIRIYKNSAINVLWDSGNIINNGLTDAAIRETMELTFVVTNVSGVYTVTEWITPSFVHNNLSSLQTTAKNTLAAAINEIYNKCNTAGGDLQGTYPNPTIKDGAVTNAKIADWSITTTKIGVGEVQSPNIGQGNSGIRTENIRDRAVTAAKLATGAVTESAVAPGSVWQGAYKDLSIPTTALSDNCITEAKIGYGALTGSRMATETISARNIAAGCISSAKLYAGIGVPFYDYVVDSNAALEALDNNTAVTNVLIKKGTWNSTKEVRITQNVRTITGEGRSYLVFSSLNGLTSYLSGSQGTPGASGPTTDNIYTQLITNVSVSARAYAFQNFTALYNCEGIVRDSFSYGSAPFYNCQKVVDCNCIAAQDGGKTFATKGCYNVRGCRQKTYNSSLSYSHSGSYSGNIASSTYACANTPNGGWNE